MDEPGDATAIDHLLPALRRREPAAFHRLHDRMAGQLQAYAQARVGDRETAEDVVQDVFLRLTRHARRFRGDGLALLAWLYTSTRRGCVDVHRRRGRRRERPVAHLPDRPDPDAGPDAAATAGVDAALAAALAALSDDQREAVLLRRVAGLTGDEVARVMDRDREAVYALCARGETRLRELLAPARPTPAGGAERMPRAVASDAGAAGRPMHDEDAP